MDYSVIENGPEHLKTIFPKAMFDSMNEGSENTEKVLLPEWEENLRRNLETLYPRHGSIARNLLGFGREKAVITVGAGPSYNKNKDVLKKVFQHNLNYDLKDQAFFIVSSNHQYKTLLKDGIFPHLVILQDSGENAKKQLCDKVPALGKDSILVASLYSDHDTLLKWDRQGKQIAFFLGGGHKELFEEETCDPYDLIYLPPGGNVLNSAFSLSCSTLHANIHICVGNDMSFEYSSDKDVRESSFYADGHTDADTVRKQYDENFAWMGFELTNENNTFTGQPVMNYKLRATSRQLFLYKSWIELHVALWNESYPEQPHHYFNCSEQGILGVITKSWDENDFYESQNWTLMDELTPKWHTMRLADAIQMYLRARTQCQIQTGTGFDAGTPNAGLWLPKMGGAGDTGLIMPNENLIVKP